MFETVKAQADAYLEQGIVGFDLMISLDGKCVLRHMGGYSDQENKIPVKGDERYEIYSCSKLITCTAALQLWEQGLLSLEDKLSKYLPEYEHMQVALEDGTLVPAESPVYIHQLFSMTGGFHYKFFPMKKLCREQTDGQCPTREFIRCLAQFPLDHQPGETWHYSLSHDILACIVEVISGMPFQDYVKKNIFDPLGMSRSTFLPTQEDLQSLCPLYTFDNELQKAVPLTTGNHFRMGSQYASGGAGCVSTVEDYMKFLEGLRTGKLLKLSTVELMQTNRLTPEQWKAYNVGNKGYGLGCRTPLPGYPYTEFGWGGAAGAYASVDLPNKMSIFFCQHLCNAPIDKSQIYLRAFEELTKTVAQEEKHTITTLY